MYSFDTRVRYSEIAEDRKAGPVSIINYFQDCCTFEAEDGGVGLKWLSDHGTAWMLTGWQVHMLRRPNYGEEIRVTTWACGFKYAFGKRSFLIQDMKGNVLVWALSDWAYVNVKEGTFEKSVPQKEIDVYGMADPISERFAEFGIVTGEEASEEVDTKVYKGKIRLPEEMEALPPITVYADNIDTNHHVNNVQYVSLAKSVISEEIDVKVLRAEIKKQSKLGDIIYPFIYQDEEKVVVRLADEEGLTKLVAEFYTAI